jgi:hypothetical protein
MLRKNMKNMQNVEALKMGVWGKITVAEQKGESGRNHRRK